jgi:hypothetical protein
MEGEMRGAASGSLYVGRGASAVHRRREVSKRRNSSHGFTEDGLVGDQQRIPQEYVVCRNIVAAVLESAVYEFRAVRAQSIRRGASLERAQVVAKESYTGRWIFGEGAQPFGFRWCCAILNDMEPERVRQALVEKMEFPRKYAVKLKAHNS